MKFNKKILSIFFIALLAIVLVACGGTTTTEAPTTAAPTTEAPTTVAPTTEAPTTVAPTTEAPTTSAPIDWVAIEASLRADYSETLDNDEFVATTNLTLVSVIGDATITWSSSDTAYLGHDGVIVQPSYALGDQTVILTATLAIGEEEHEVMFFVTIDALAKTDLERATEALATVMIFPFKEKWTEADSDSLELLAVAKDADNVEYPVVWTSSNPTYISAEGVITQPAETEEDVVVTLTATITINTVEYTSTKDFTVAKKVGATVVTSIADAIALGVDAYVEITGVTFIGKVTNGGYYFTDGTDLIYAYTNSLAVTIGAVYDLKGMVDEYYGYSQLNTGTDTPIMVTASTEPVSVFVPTVQTIAYIMENATAADGDMKIATAYTVTGRVYYAPNYTDPVYLVPSDYDFVNNFAANAKPIGDALEIYDYSNDELLIPFHGQEVTIVLIPLGYHSTHANHYAYFIGSSEDIVVTIEDDATAVATALDSLTYPTTIVADTTLDFPASLFGVTLTYESDNAAINATTGFVDAATQTTQVTVTLTVTATRGTVTDTKVFTIKVGELPISDLADLYSMADGTKVKVQGILTADTKVSAFWLQDETAGINLYVPSALRTEFAALDLGVELLIEGELYIFNGLYEVAYFTYTVVNATPNLPIPADINDVEFTNVGLSPYMSQLVSFQGFVLDAVVTGTADLIFTMSNPSNGYTISVRIEDDATGYAALAAEVKAALAGDTIVIEGGIIGWYNGYQLLLSYPEQFRLATDAEKLAMDTATILTTKETTSGASETVVLEGPYGSTIVWDMTTIVAAGGTFDPITGAVVMPSVETNTDYAITATLSLGTETDVVVNVVVTVLAMTDADKLAAAIADTGIDQDCDGYQVVTLPTTGLYGTTITWALVSGEATLDGAVITYHQTELAGTVVLDATFVNGTASQVVSYTINVTPVTVVTDLATLYVKTDGTNYDVVNGQFIYVTGIVTGNSFDGLFIQDVNGVGLALYRPDSDSTMVVGDEVVYYGQINTTTYGVRELANGADLMDLVSTGNTVVPNLFTVTDMLNLDETDAGKLITFTGLTVKQYTSTDVYFEVTDGVNTREIRHRYYGTYAAWLPDIYPVGTTLPEVQFIFFNFRDGFAQIDMLAITMTDAQAQAYDASQVPATLEIAADYVIPSAKYGSTYTVTEITGDAVTYIDFTTTPGTLLVTRPAEGQPNATGVITVEVTKGTEVAVVETIDVTIYATGVSFEQAVYTTSFAVADGFTTGTVYNNTTIKLDGPVSQQWGTYFGTVSTTSAITTTSIQLRYYTATPALYGYAFTDFDTLDATKISFWAKAVAGTTVEVLISKDGGATWISAQEYALTTTAAEYTYTINELDLVGNFRFKIQIKTPSGRADVVIDDVIIYGMRS